MKKSWKQTMRYHQQRFINIPNVDTSNRCGQYDCHNNFLLSTDPYRHWSVPHFQWSSSLRYPQTFPLANVLQVSSIVFFNQLSLFTSAKLFEWRMKLTQQKCSSRSELTRKADWCSLWTHYR